MASSLVSIIIPAYNAERFIRRTIESVVAQTYPHWELIVADDCSTDGTRDIVSGLAYQDQRIRLIAAECNFGGPAGPRNMAAREAKGEWIALLDADDVWHPEKLAFQIRFLVQTRAEFCSTQMRDFSRDEELAFAPAGDVGLTRITFRQQLRKNRTPNSSVVVRRELLLRHPFNEDPRYKATEDYDCWLRIHEVIGSSIKISYPFLSYRRSDGQISGAKITMLKRKSFVLRQYRLRSGVPLGWRRFLYLGTYIGYSVYYRVIKRSL